jgi:hypothetical protein
MVGVGARVLQVLLVIGAILMLAPPAVAAASGSWTSGEYTWGERQIIDAAINEQQCYSATVTIVGVTSLPENGKVCVYERPNFRYAVYHKSIPNWWGGYYTQDYFVIGLGSDRKMYVVENMRTTAPLDVPNSNDLHYNTLTTGFTNNHVLSYISNLPSKLIKVTEFGQTLRYQLVDNASHPFIPTI